MTDLAPFPDVEALLVTALSEFGATGTVTPDDLQSRLPFHRIKRLQGSGNLISNNPRVEIITFTTSRAESWRLAALIEQRLISNIRAVPKVDKAISSGLTEIPYEDQNIRAVLHSYELSTRR